MTRWIRPAAFISALFLAPAPFAQEFSPSAPPPVGSEPAIAPGVDVATPETVTETRPVTSVTGAARYGLGARMRWITVPKWILNMFSKANVPLSTYGFAVEGLRRKMYRDNSGSGWEISMAIGYQKMGPGDGNWLGKNKEAALDTDLVQFRNFGLITWDATFLGRQYFTPYFGMHYGAGLGLGVVTGKVLRTSAAGCTDANASNMAACKPIVCKGASCTEAELKASESSAPDRGPGAPARFREDSVPSAVPIIHLLFGLDFPIPDAKGLEFRLEGGFYDALFLGGAAGYVF